MTHFTPSPCRYLSPGQHAALGQRQYRPDPSSEMQEPYDLKTGHFLYLFPRLADRSDNSTYLVALLQDEMR